MANLKWQIAGAALALAVSAIPAVAKDAGKVDVSANAPAEIFSRLWWHPSLPGLEPLASGPTSLINRSRLKLNGASDYGQLVGDYTNPILKPETAAVVKKFGERSLAGEVYPNPANQCWPEPGTFIYKNFGLNILKNKPDELTFLYEGDHEVRHVRMNAAHRKNMKPSWYGDSVGHWEGDTLVVDTVGIKADRPYAMIDLYGTPYSKALHIVERIRLVGYEEAKEARARDVKENLYIPGVTIPDWRGNYLQVLVTVEDPNMFTTPWSATLTYAPGPTAWPEVVCAENPRDFAGDEDVPEAKTPDF